MTVTIDGFKQTVQQAVDSGGALSGSEFSDIQAQLAQLTPADKTAAAGWLKEKFPALSASLSAPAGYGSYEGARPVIYDRAAKISPALAAILAKWEQRDSLATPLDLRPNGPGAGLGGEDVQALFSQLTPAEMKTVASEMLFAKDGPLDMKATDEGMQAFGQMLVFAGYSESDLSAAITNLGASEATAKLLRAGYAEASKPPEEDKGAKGGKAPPAKAPAPDAPEAPAAAAPRANPYASAGATFTGVAADKPGQVSASVRQAQRDLDALGFGVGKWGADGRLGPDTQTAIDKFKEANKMPKDAPASDVRAAIAAAAAAKRGSSAEAKGAPPPAKADAAPPAPPVAVPPPVVLPLQLSEKAQAMQKLLDVGEGFLKGPQESRWRGYTSISTAYDALVKETGGEYAPLKARYNTLLAAANEAGKDNTANPMLKPL